MRKKFRIHELWVFLMKIRFLIFIVIILSGRLALACEDVSPCNPQQLYKAALLELDKGNLKSAVNYFERSASGGFAPSEIKLCELSIRKADSRSFSLDSSNWCKRPASEKYKKELNTKASGEVKNKKYSEAIAQYTLASSLGSKEADLQLGTMFFAGLGVEKDYKKAFFYLQPLAEAGNAKAQFIVGSMYELGHGVKQSWHDAVAWYEKSASQKNAAATSVLAYLYRTGESDPVIKRDVKKARELYGKIENYPLAQRELGQMYELGEGGGVDKKKAAELYKRATRQGDAPAHQHLASLYLRGEGVSEDMVKAAALFILGDGEELSDSSRELLGLMNPEQGEKIKYLLNNTEELYK